jgi:hypothetical protein
VQIPRFWVAMQIVIVLLCIASAVIALIKL